MYELFNLLIKKTSSSLAPKKALPTRHSPAFTLVELLIVIIVIALLATIIIVAYSGLQSRAKDSAVKADLNQAAKQLAMDKAIAGEYPIGSGTPPSSLAAGDGTTYEYTSDGDTFCLSGINGDKAVFHITQAGDIKSGVCPGHSGPIAGGGGSTHSCDPGYIPVPGDSRFGTSDFCVAKYEAKNVDGKAVSQAAGLPWVNIAEEDAAPIASSACSGCHLITEAEWLTIAHNVLSVASNWSGGSVGSGYIYSGHNDNSPANSLAASTSDSDGYSGTGNSSGNQRRTLTLSNGEVIWDFAGNVWEWAAGEFFVEISSPSGEWNSVAISGNLTPSPIPSFGTPAAANWTTSNGIGGTPYTNHCSITRSLPPCNFARGGDWGTQDGAGIFSLRTDLLPGDTAHQVGFRLAR